MDTEPAGRPDGYVAAADRSGQVVPFPSIRHGVIAGAGRAHARPTLPARPFQRPHPKKVVG